MRYLSATLGVRSLAVPLAALLLMTFARPGLAQGGPDIQTPVEVRSVEVRSVEGGADVFVGVNNGAEWTADQGPNDTLIIRLPRSVPGPRALDVTPSTGFVSRVEVGFGVPEGVPTSKLTVHARQSFRHRVIRERNRLRVELRLTGAEGPRTGEATRPTPQAIGPTSEPRPDTSPESSGGQVDELELGGDRIAGLERALARERSRSEQPERLQAELQVRLDEVQRDSETHRQRVSALHADRLQLIEDLRIAREVAAEASSDADAGRANAVDQQDLAAIVGERDAARSEAADLRRQLEARETALAEVVDNREKLAGELAASEDRRREESAELALVSEELVSLRTSRQDASLLEQTLAGVTSDRDRLAREFEAASGNVENARAAQLAETVALRQQLQELQSARDSVAQRLSEVERDRGRSQAEGERLSSDLAAARTRLAAGLEEESAESAALRSRVAALSQSVSDAETAAGKAAKDLEASRERSRQLEQALADARRETESGESEALNGLRTQLEESRRNEADLRGWLSRAPRLLGVSSMAVARTVSPCLSLRPQPSLESPVLDCLSPGTVVEVLSMRADWLRVRLADRREGWVGQRFMEASTSNDLAQLTAASQRANKDAEKLRSDRDALRTRIAELERQSEEAREAASRELSAHTEEIERFRSQLAAATAETSSLENRLADAVSKSAGLAEMEAELATASMAAVEAQATIAALQLANDRLSGERQLREAVAEDRDLLAAKADSAARRIEELETALAAAELNGERLGASLSAASEELTALSQAAAEADGLRRRASGRSEAIEELAAQIEGLRSELADAQSALAQSRSDLLSSDSLVRDKMLRFTEIAGTGAVVVSSAAEPCLKLRTGPAAAAEAFDCVEPGTRFTLLDVDQEWIEVAASGDRRGWVSGHYLEPESGRRIRRAEADLEPAQEAATAAAEVARSEAEADAGEMHSLELEKLRQELEVERRKSSHAIASRDELTEKIKAARQRIQELELSEDLAATETGEQLDGLRARHSEAEARLATSDSTRQQLQDELDRSRETIEDLGRRLAAVEEEAAALMETRQELGTQVAGHSRKTAEAEGELAAMQRERELLRGRNDILEARLVEEETLARVQEPVRPLEPLSSMGEDPIEKSPAEGEMPETPRPHVRSSDLAAFALGWAQAWSAQNAELYLSHYSPGFQPAYGIDRGRWEGQRRQRLAAPSFVEVELSSIGLRIDSPTRAAVSFTQLYRSNTFEDVVTKTLELALEAGEWKILREIAE